MSTSKPTCYYCSSLPLDIQSLVITNDSGEITGYQRGHCASHRRMQVWGEIRPMSEDSEEYCTECGHDIGVIYFEYNYQDHSSDDLRAYPYTVNLFGAYDSIAVSLNHVALRLAIHLHQQHPIFFDDDGHPISAAYLNAHHNEYRPTLHQIAQSLDGGPLTCENCDSEYSYELLD